MDELYSAHEHPLLGGTGSAFAGIAVQTGRGADEVVKDFVQTQLEHDTWFRAEVEKGLQQLDRGEYVTHEEVVRRVALRFKAT